MSQPAVKTLLDPVIKTELGPWQKSFIIKTLLAQGKNSDAIIITGHSKLLSMLLIILLLEKGQQVKF